MRISHLASIAVAALLLIGSQASASDGASRIYGKIYTIDGDVLEGFIRWDKNEAHWFDHLDGTKERHESMRDMVNVREDRGRRRYSDRGRDRDRTFFGISVGSRNSWVSTASSMSLRFGHIREMIVIDDDAVRLVLKSDEDIDVENSSTDIGTAIREIVIEDQREGELELVWEDIDRIEFMGAPAGETSNFGDRLYGTVETRRGESFTGFITWDIDEIFGDDILDGEERGRDRRIRFRQIAGIERYSSSGAVVLMKDGDELTLRESNDVDSGNRGILIADPAMGQVEVEWNEFDRVTFADPPAGPRYDDFDGGARIYGTVTTEFGDEFTGEIVWDDDERHTWEILDGDWRSVDYDIEFGLIASITKSSDRGSVVTLRDGREIELRNSNDIDSDNKGIYIRVGDDEWELVEWEDFDKVEFSSR